jgi:pimeloyl-ACP methyl ester carboxylesterase
MIEPITHTVEAPGAMLTYDVRKPETPSVHRPLFIFGSPMGASGFEQLVSQFGDRTVITYDPRGMERSTREAGGELTAEVHAEDYHRVLQAAKLGPVDAFASSGGAMCALHWVVAHPEDVRTLVAHEPPLLALLEDRETAIRVTADIVETYQRAGYGPAMAKFIQLVMVRGPLPDDYLDQPAPNPARFGLPAEDDGSRGDLLLSGNLAMPPFVPDADALRTTPVRVIPAIVSSGRVVWPAAAARRSRTCWASSPCSSPATTVASPPTSGPRTTTPPRSPRSCARCSTRNVPAGPARASLPSRVSYVDGLTRRCDRYLSREQSHPWCCHAAKREVQNASTLPDRYSRPIP